MLKVWVGLEARKFLQASIDDVSAFISFAQCLGILLRLGSWQWSVISWDLYVLDTVAPMVLRSPGSSFRESLSSCIRAPFELV